MGIKPFLFILAVFASIHGMASDSSSSIFEGTPLEEADTQIARTR